MSVPEAMAGSNGAAAGEAPPPAAEQAAAAAAQQAAEPAAEQVAAPAAEQAADRAADQAAAPAGAPMEAQAPAETAPAPASELAPQQEAAAPSPEPAAPAPASAPEPTAAVPAAAVAAGGGGSLETLSADVARLKATLDDSTATADIHLEALAQLRARGSLPTKVLSDTLIGKTVNTLAKASQSEAVKASARGLVETWRNTHRKRKAGSAGLGDDVTPKRTLSTASVDSEAVTPGAIPASQEELLQRNLSTDSLMGSQPAPEDGSADKDKSASKMTPQREKVRQKLLEALGKEEAIEAKGDTNPDQDKLKDPLALASEIEEALFKHFEGKEKDYVLQARTIIFNLKDKKNHNFRLKLLVGFFHPEQVPTLTAEDMASDAKNAERAKLRQYSMEEIQSDWMLQKGKLQITGMFTCGKCKGTKTTYFQMQTRSSDEPMTTFVTCITCNNRWKFC